MYVPVCVYVCVEWLYRWKDTILTLEAWESAPMSIYHATVIIVASDKHGSGSFQNRSSQAGRRWLRAVPDLQASRPHSQEHGAESDRRHKRQKNSGRPGRIAPPESTAHTCSRASGRALKNSQGVSAKNRSRRGSPSHSQLMHDDIRNPRTSAHTSHSGVRYSQNGVRASSSSKQYVRVAQSSRSVQSSASFRSISTSQRIRTARKRSGTAAQNVRMAEDANGRSSSANLSSRAYRHTSARSGKISRPYTPAEQAIRERRQRQARRALMWILIIGIAVGAVWLGVQKINTSLRDIKIATAAPDPADEYKEIACTPKMLSAQLSQRSTYAGKEVVFSAVLTNSDVKRACHIDAGYENIYFLLTSGEQTVWNSRTCKVGEDSELLLIGPKREGHVSVAWNGINAGSVCSGENLAGAGTYHAQLMWEDKPLGDAIAFELKAESASPSDSASNTASSSESVPDSEKSPSGSSQEEDSSASAD